MPLDDKIRGAIINLKKAEGERMSSNVRDSLKIGVWGPSSAGKTTFIVTVWGACLSPQSRWLATLADSPTSDFIIDRLTRLRKGEFPEPNKPQPEPIHYQYLFSPKPTKQQNQAGKTTKSPFESLKEWINADDVRTPTKVTGNSNLKISFTDVAGEQYFKDALDSPLWDDIVTCDGLLCILDPSDSEEHLKMVLKLGQNLRLKSNDSPRLIGNYLPHYIALCFSKIDRPEFYPFHDRPDELNAKLSEETGIDLQSVLNNFFVPDRTKVFCVSAIGVNANGQSLVQSGQIVTPNKIRPINIIAPLRWLFESLQSGRP